MPLSLIELLGNWAFSPFYICLTSLFSLFCLRIILTYVLKMSWPPEWQQDCEIIKNRNVQIGMSHTGASYCEASINNRGKYLFVGLFLLRYMILQCKKLQSCRAKSFPVRLCGILSVRVCLSVAGCVYQHPPCLRVIHNNQWQLNSRLVCTGRGRPRNTAHLLIVFVCMCVRDSDSHN